MQARYPLLALVLWLLAGAAPLATPAAAADLPLNKGLVAVGRLPAALRDKFGETFGSGSGMAALDFRKTDTGYAGEVEMLITKNLQCYNCVGPSKPHTITKEVPNWIIKV